MRRVANPSVLAPLVALLGVTLAPANAPGQSGQSVLMPPQAHVLGKSFQEWNILHDQSVIAAELGDGMDGGGSFGHVAFLPANFTGNPAPEADVTIAPGTFLVAPPVFLFGERYDDPTVPDDSPSDLADFLAATFSAVQVEITLDGKVALDASGDALAPYIYGPTYFAEPIPYAEPQPRGAGLNAVAALWGMGVGAILHPLPPGHHTLVVTATDWAFGDFTYTYHITVTPK
jgi:hypothetical protein